MTEQSSVIVQKPPKEICCRVMEIYVGSKEEPFYQLKVQNEISQEDQASQILQFIQNLARMNNLQDADYCLADKSSNQPLDLTNINKQLKAIVINLNNNSNGENILLPNYQPNHQCNNCTANNPQQLQNNIKNSNNYDEERKANEAPSRQNGSAPQSQQQGKSDHVLFRSGEIEQEPEQPNSCVLSTSKQLGSFSFVSTTALVQPNHYLYAPPPIYLPHQYLISKMKGTSRDELFKGMEINSSGEIKLVDKELLDKQKGVISDVIKKVAESLSAGRGIVGVSLPVRIFEQRSMIERVVDWWSYAPVYLSPSVALKDPVDRMKNAIAFAFAGLSVSVSQLKPFNPLLGETYQAMFPDGTEVFCEHTSHHPPITNFFLTGNHYRFYGRYEYIAKPNATFNVMNLLQDGQNTIEYDFGEKIVYQLPGIKMSGLVLGDRLIKWTGVMKFVDKKNNLKAIIKFGKEVKKGLFSKKKADLIEGKLYYTKKDVELPKEKKRKDEDKQDLKYKDLDKLIAEISGSYLDKLVIGEQEIWNINQHSPVRQKPIQHPLPSDPRFREDLLWMVHNEVKNAEKWKERLEVQQRSERKLREEGAKLKKTK